MKKHFSTLKIDKTFSLGVEGIEIKSYIAGVNSGVYSLPYVISVRTWAKKFWFKRFFEKRVSLDLKEVILLRDELNQVIKFYENK